MIDVGANRSVAELRRVLNANGMLVLVGADKRGGVAILTRIIAAFARSRLLRQRIVFYVAKATQDDLAEAVRYVGSGQARAKVVITM